MKVIPVSVGQSFLVGDPEDDDQVLVLTLSSTDPFPTAYCIFHNSIDCSHTDAIQHPENS